MLYHKVRKLGISCSDTIAKKILLSVVFVGPLRKIDRHAARQIFRYRLPPERPKSYSEVRLLRPHVMKCLLDLEEAPIEIPVLV